MRNKLDKEIKELANRRESSAFDMPTDVLLSAAILIKKLECFANPADKKKLIIEFLEVAKNSLTDKGFDEKTEGYRSYANRIRQAIADVIPEIDRLINESRHGGQTG